MRSKCLFIVPPCLDIAHLVPDKSATFSSKIRKEMPLGVLSLATYLESKCGMKVKIIDFNVIFYDLMIKNKLQDNKYETLLDLFKQNILLAAEGEIYDVAGISAIFSPNYGYLSIISDCLKQIYPNILIATGGGVPTNMPVQVFRDAPNIDIICYGEGELGLAGVVGAENETMFLEESASLLTREKLANGFVPSFDFIEDLDEIPPYDYSLIDFDSYISHAHTMDEKKLRSMPLMFSRGCPFHCCFCAAHSVHGRKVRYNSLSRIKRDVLEAVERFQVNSITVWDDNFFVDRDNALNMLSFFRSLDLNIEFVNGFPVYQMDDEMAEALLESGADSVTLAIESGCPRVLKDIIHKPLTIDMVPKAIKILRKYDFFVKGLFVIGFPGETKADLQETINFIQQSDLNWVDIYIASPLPGSELLDKCIDGGYIKAQSVEKTDFWHASIETEHFTRCEIEDIQQYNILKKDYVQNLDMRLGKWVRALVNFEYVINAHHENPFAYYYGAMAAKKLGDETKATSYYTSWQQILNEHKAWRNMVKRFECEGERFALSYDEL